MSDMINAFLFAMMLDAHPFQSGCMTSRRVSLFDKGSLFFHSASHMIYELLERAMLFIIAMQTRRSSAREPKKCAMFTPIADKFKGHRSFLR